MKSEEYYVSSAEQDDRPDLKLTLRHRGSQHDRRVCGWPHTGVAISEICAAIRHDKQAMRAKDGAARPMPSEELPPGPTWDEAIAVIRQHDGQTANRLEHDRYLVISRAWSPATWAISQSTALARLESQALDLFEQINRKKEATDAE